MTLKGHLNSSSSRKLRSQQSHCHLCATFVHSWVSGQSLCENWRRCPFFQANVALCLSTRLVQESMDWTELPVAPRADVHQNLGTEKGTSKSLWVQSQFELLSVGPGPQIHAPECLGGSTRLGDWPFYSHPPLTHSEFCTSG